MLFYWTLIFAIFCNFSTQENQPNFLFILTDDQDVVLDGFTPMTTLRNTPGVFFNNCIATTPVCCPSRSSILTGVYQHNHKVLNNSQEGNCYGDRWRHEFELKKSLAVYLKRKNYQTFYAGKYLNQYGKHGQHAAPTGWDWWVGLIGNSKYYNYSLSINGSLKHFENDYLTDVIKDYALNFLKTKPQQPFFMFLAPPAPHAPFIPAPRHQHLYENVSVTKTPNFNLSSRILNQKHWLMRMQPEQLPAEAEDTLSEIYRNRWRTLASVDEMIKDVIDRMKELGVWSETYLIFTSDNGYHLGQFSQPYDKRQPYNTDIKVPLFIQHGNPAYIQSKVTNKQVATIDILPTILDMADISLSYDVKIDGISFMAELGQHSEPTNIAYREYLLIEYYGESYPKSVNTNDCPDLAKQQNEFMECSKTNFCKCQDVKNNSYTCLKSSTLLDCYFYDDESFRETYDLVKDPWQMHNLAPNLIKDRKNLVKFLQNCSGIACHFA